MFRSRVPRNSVPAAADAINGTSGENNNLYYYTPNLASRLVGPAAGGQPSAQNPTFAMLNTASDSEASRLAPSPSDPSPLMDDMMVAGGESDISDFRMRAVMVFTYIGFAFLTIVLLGTFIVSMYWTLSGSCSKQKDQQGKKKVQSGGCCSIEDAPRPAAVQQNGSAIGVGSSSNGSQKKPKRKTSPRSSKYNETGIIGDEESNCELLEWDRQTQVIEMEDL